MDSRAAPDGEREPGFRQVHRYDICEVTAVRHIIASRVPSRELRLPERLALAEIQDSLRAVYLCKDFSGNGAFPFGSG
jgi:hypothetical protein